MLKQPTSSTHFPLQQQALPTATDLVISLDIVKTGHQSLEDDQPPMLQALVPVCFG